MRLSAERGRRNCLIRGGGRVEPLRLPGDARDVVLLPFPDGEVVEVLPDDKLELWRSLAPEQGPMFWSSEGWRPGNVLVGHAALVRQTSVTAEKSATD